MGRTSALLSEFLVHAINDALAAVISFSKTRKK
jgi:hypothetical protein